MSTNVELGNIIFTEKIEGAIIRKYHLGIWDLRLFWVITQRVVVISYRSFGTAYRSDRQDKNLEDGTDRLYRDVCKKLPLLAA